MSNIQILSKANFIIKEVDTQEVFRLALLHDDDTQPDLTGCTATIYIADKNNVLVEKPMTIETEEQGVVSFRFEEGDNLIAGEYDVEVVVVDAEGKRETFPDATYMKLKVFKNLKNR